MESILWETTVELVSVPFQEWISFRGNLTVHLVSVLCQSPNICGIVTLERPSACEKNLFLCIFSRGIGSSIARGGVADWCYVPLQFGN